MSPLVKRRQGWAAETQAAALLAAPLLAAAVLAAACGATSPKPSASQNSVTTAISRSTTSATTTSTTIASTTNPPGAATASTAAPATTARVPTSTTRRPTTTTGRPATPPSVACPSNLAGRLAGTGGGTQVVTVEAAATASTTATVTLWQRLNGCWMAAAGPWTGAVGYNGVSTHHREGDGTSPIGLFGISSQFYGNAANPGVHGSYHQLVCGDWWDEDPTSAAYNTFQHVPCGQSPPFGGGSEALWTETIAYQSFAVVEYNTGPVVPYAGSAIFIHDNIGSPTNGCVSVPAGDLVTLLRWLQPGASPHIVIGTASDIQSY